jgi:NhaP-type Na+/H+ or K+/H+ antiporter
VTPLVILAAAILLWVLCSERLRSASITAPIILTTVGFLAAVSPLDVGVLIRPEATQLLIELTLAVVLFVDASSIAADWLRHEWRYPARLLGIGFPLTFALGTVVALVLFAGLDPWVAAVIGAALAPTDAALGLAIIENPRIPLRLRRVINVESGLNDGLATPVVAFCVALAAASVDHLKDRPFVSALASIALGVVLGLVAGAVSGRLTRIATQRRWAEAALVPLVPAVVALGTYALVVAAGGNGFVGAFVAGMAFGAESTRGRPAGADHASLALVHGVSQLMGYAVWFIFGASILARIEIDRVPRALLYAVLSLTVVRMLPVAIAALGGRLPWDTVLLVGWLGPRGLASIIFGVMAAETIGGHDGDFVLEVVAVTVALSVLAHGLSAGPLAEWYARRHPVEALDPAEPAASTG